jgi:CubicO group peptidase (beta-lactamase class C family)
MSASGENRMKKLWLILIVMAVNAPLLAGDYFPPRGDWAYIEPATVGMDPEKLAAAIALAKDKAVVEPSDLAQAIVDSFSPREPDFRILGPTRPRKGASGMVIRNGYIAAEFGDVRRVDMTFSAVKSYLSTMAALAMRHGLITDIDQKVWKLTRDDHFESDHNYRITWRHLLNQTSDWQGTLWGVPDWADRPEGDDPAQWPNRELHQPGSYFKYNDVRVNLLAYSLLQVWRKPLPVVLKEEVMDPIGASSSWRWHGYENSWVTLDGQKMQSVSGGGHFGGGLFISTRDHARFGLLFLRNGRWGDRQIVPAEWIDALREPTPVRRDYGLMWWLNTGRERIPAAPASAFWASGFGGNYIYVDQENDLLIVLRWIPALKEVVEAVMAAIVEG